MSSNTQAYVQGRSKIYFIVIFDFYWSFKQQKKTQASQISQVVHQQLRDIDDDIEKTIKLYQDIYTKMRGT